MTTRSSHVVPNPNGGWDVRAPGSARASDHAATKEQAVASARRMLGAAGGGELVVHGKDGRIQSTKTTVRTARRRPAELETASIPEVEVDGVRIRGLSVEDARTAVRLLRAAREHQFENGRIAAQGLLRTMVDADVDLIAPSSVEQARRLAGVRRALLTTPVFTYETLSEVRGDANVSTTRTWVSRSRERGRVFTVKLDGRSILPASQLTEAGAAREEYEDTLRPLLAAGLDGWTIWIWLTSPSPLLSGETPEAIIVDAPERVSRAARRFAASGRSAA